MRILGVGHCTMDHLGVVERFAEPDFKLELDQFSLQGGGAAATAMVALARWGVETSFLGKVGDDGRGRWITQTLSAEGVDTAGLVVQADGISQASFIIVESASGHKKTYYTHGNIDPLTPKEVSVEALEGVDVLHVDGSAPAAQLKLMKAARERGTTTVLDAERVDGRVDALVGYSDYMVSSERFASQFTGEGAIEAMCRALLERGPQVAVVTLGDEGSAAMRRGEDRLIREPAYAVHELDTTGAGDIFHGGFLYGIVQGWELARTVRFANVAASLACTGLGGRSVIASVDEIERRLREQRSA